MVVAVLFMYGYESTPNKLDVFSNMAITAALLSFVTPNVTWRGSIDFSRALRASRYGTAGYFSSSFTYQPNSAL